LQDISINEAWEAVVNEADVKAEVLLRTVNLQIWGNFGATRLAFLVFEGKTPS